MSDATDASVYICGKGAPPVKVQLELPEHVFKFYCEASARRKVPARQIMQDILADGIRPSMVTDERDFSKNRFDG